MDLVDMARRSGMTVVLDARIGRLEYRSVYGSLDALQQLVDLAIESIGVDRTGPPRRAVQNGSNPA